MSTVLFACVHNAGRSQMAAAFFLCTRNSARSQMAEARPASSLL
jgi:protein-tyrosine-phosphatase